MWCTGKILGGHTEDQMNFKKAENFPVTTNVAWQYTPLTNRYSNREGAKYDTVKQIISWEMPFYSRSCHIPHPSMTATDSEQSMSSSIRLEVHRLKDEPLVPYNDLIQLFKNSDDTENVYLLKSICHRLHAKNQFINLTVE